MASPASPAPAAPAAPAAPVGPVGPAAPVGPVAQGPFGHGRGRSFLLFFACLLGLGLLLPGYELLAVNQHLLLCCNVLALNFCLGLGGQVCMAQGAFCALGAYGSVMLHAAFPGGGAWIVPSVALATALLGAGVSRPLERLGAGFLSMATLGVHCIVINLLLAFPAHTGGAEGLVAAVPIRLPEFLGGGRLSGDFPNFLAFWLLLLAGCWIYAALEASRPGRALLACREDVFAASACGIDRSTMRAWAFALGAGLSALAGSVHGHYGGFISPRQFDLELSLKTLLYLVIGQPGNLFSPLLAVLVLETVLSRLDFLGEGRSLVHGLLLAVALLLGPAQRRRLGETLRGLLAFRSGRVEPRG